MKKKRTRREPVSTKLLKNLCIETKRNLPIYYECTYVQILMCTRLVCLSLFFLHNYIKICPKDITRDKGWCKNNKIMRGFGHFTSHLPCVQYNTESV